MKRFLNTLLLCSLVAGGAAAQQSLPQQERLGRALVAVKSEGGVFLSWRLLGADDEATAFDLYRDGKKINKTPLAGATSYTDPYGDTQSRYSVRATGADGEAGDGCGPVAVWPTPCLVIPTRTPQGVEGSDRQSSYRYTPGDASAGDVDGDGEYEIILQWNPSNAKDNSHSGTSGEVFIDCYKLNGTFLWRVALGRNLRAGAHYNPFLVYDFDGDGKAELVCKTAPGTLDGRGEPVLLPGDDAAADYRNGRGYILQGPEYLTVFGGERGEALATVPYHPARDVHRFAKGDSASDNAWGDDYGNRCDRYLACAAYLDGLRPSIVMCRGYYTYSHLTAYDFDGQRLALRWSYASPFGQEAYGQGAHSLSVGDVDGDGCDEIVYGSATIDHDGSCLYSTGLGHGDALHLSDLDPDVEGLELFMPHEEPPFGHHMHRAATGELLMRATDSNDTGRGIAADIDAASRGLECWSLASRNLFDCKGGVLSEGVRPRSVNFRIYWDGDLCDELLDGTRIEKWNGNGTDKLVDFADGTAARSCNGTKRTPNLQADLLGDWREEVLLWDGDSNSLLLFTTTLPTDYRVPCLMLDHVYRMGIVWQNVAYNQPPHLGYYLPDAVEEKAKK